MAYSIFFLATKILLENPHMTTRRDFHRNPGGVEDVTLSNEAIWHDYDLEQSQRNTTVHLPAGRTNATMGRKATQTPKAIDATQPNLHGSSGNRDTMPLPLNIPHSSGERDAMQTLLQGTTNTMRLDSTYLLQPANAMRCSYCLKQL